MKARFTIPQLEELKAAGKIQGFVIKQKEKAKSQKKPGKIGGRIVTKHYPRKSKALNWMGYILLEWCNAKALILHEEYRFLEDRGWRFDWAIESLKIAFEFEGGIFEANSGHKTAKHYTKDVEKYNKAAEIGWRVLRYTALNYTDLLVDLSNIKM